MKKILMVVAVLMVFGIGSSIMGQQIASGKWKAEKGDPGFNLHENEGSRMYSIEVIFEKPFEVRPEIILTTSKIDADAQTNVRYEISANAVSRDGFVLKVNTWNDTKIYQLEGSWLAYTNKVEE